MNDRLRELPRVDRILAHVLLDEARAGLGADVLRELVRGTVAAARDAVRAGAEPIDEHEAAARVAARARAWDAQRTRDVVNATGVLLHTNLGRAPLSDRAARAVFDSASRYASLEIDLATGKRGGRAAFAETALASLTGAEAALVVNNNAAAVLLALSAVALGRAVVVSRGELVEIGGGFRIPEVLARSGARLVEVGTTNRTKLADYARALDDHGDVAAILRVHRGNFRQTGFVEQPSLAELCGLAASRGVRVVEDLGGGALEDLSREGLAHDPLVRDGVRAGADLVTFSTDKILGGPQGGALVGRRDAVERARRDPLARALRIGRLPLVALEATLSSYLEEGASSIPVVAMARRTPAELARRVERWRDALVADDASLADRIHIADVDSVAGGGTYAGDVIASVALSLDVDDPDAFVTRLRCGDPPVIARIADGAVVLDARTVFPEEDGALVEALRVALRVASR